VSQW